jgi:hypothetical protein
VKVVNEMIRKYPESISSTTWRLMNSAGKEFDFDIQSLDDRYD